MAVTFYPNLIQKNGFDATAEPSITGNNYVSSGSETTGALYDLLDNRRTNVVTIDSSGESGQIVIRTDVTSAMNCDFCIIDNHSLNSAGAACDILQGTVGVSIANSYSGTLGSELSDDSPGGTFTPGADGITLVTFTDASDTRWELTMDETVANFAADITMGEIVLGNAWGPPTNPELQPLFNYDMPGSSFRESDGGQRYGFSTHSNSRRAWRLTWKYMSDQSKLTLETNVFNWTRGGKYPLYVDLGPVLGDTNPRLYYVRFMKPLSFTGITKDAWQVTVDIEEEL